MLAEKFTEDTPLPLPGSFGFLRGTAQRCRVLRRDRDGACLVKLFERKTVATRSPHDDESICADAWRPLPGSSGNRSVDEGDLYPDERAAMHAGRPDKLSRGKAPEVPASRFTDPPRQQRQPGKPRGRR